MEPVGQFGLFVRQEFNTILCNVNVFLSKFQVWFDNTRRSDRSHSCSKLDVEKQSVGNIHVEMEPLSPREKFEQSRNKFNKKSEDSMPEQYPSRSTFSVRQRDQLQPSDNTHHSQSQRYSRLFTYLTMDRHSNPDLNESVVETDQEEHEQYRRDIQRQSARIYERTQDMPDMRSSRSSSSTTPYGGHFREVTARRSKSFPNISVDLEDTTELALVSGEPTVDYPVNSKTLSLPRNTKSISRSRGKYYRQASDSDHQNYDWNTEVSPGSDVGHDRRSDYKGEGHNLRSDEIYPALDVSTDRIEIHHAVVKNIKTITIPDAPGVTKGISDTDSTLYPVAKDNIDTGSMETSSTADNDNNNLDNTSSAKPDSHNGKKKENKRKGSRARGIKKLRSILKKKGKKLLSYSGC